MINAAIVGLGRWGKKLVDAVQDKSEVLRFVCACARRPDAVADYARQRGIEVTPDLGEVLADPKVQAVVLATPHTLHAQQIVAAAAAGKHVFCEKPLALDRGGAQRAADACRQAGVVLGVGHDKHFCSSMRELRRVVKSGDLGEILHIEGHNSNETSGEFTPWRDSPQESPGGGMTGAGIHILDAFVTLMGPVRRVQAQLISRRPPPHVLDTVSILFEFANQVSGVLCTVRATPSVWRVHVFGARGSAEAVGRTDLVLRISGAQPQHLSFETVDTLRSELEAFGRAVAGGAPYPISTLQMVNTAAAFEAVVQAIEKDAPVMV